MQDEFLRLQQRCRRPSSSSPTTSRKPSAWPTASPSCARARSSRSAGRPTSCAIPPTTMSRSSSRTCRWCVSIHGRRHRRPARRIDCGPRIDDGATPHATVEELAGRDLASGITGFRVVECRRRRARARSIRKPCSRSSTATGETAALTALAGQPHRGGCAGIAGLSVWLAVLLVHDPLPGAARRACPGSPPIRPIGSPPIAPCDRRRSAAIVTELVKPAFRGIAWLLDWPMRGMQAVLQWIPWPMHAGADRRYRAACRRLAPGAVCALARSPISWSPATGGRA